jgi:hypothetical protein
LERKVGDKSHLKLNTGGAPIAQKYREGKMKRTLERELKVPEIAEREVEEMSHPVKRLGMVKPSIDLSVLLFACSRPTRFAMGSLWVFLLSIGITSLCDTVPLMVREFILIAEFVSEIVDLADFFYPVLKHGPRSLTLVQVQR